MSDFSHKEHKEHKEGRCALVAASGRAVVPRPPQGHLSHAEAQRGRERGDLPKVWEVRRIKSLMRPHKKLVGKRSSEYDLLSLTLRGVVKRDMENPEGKFPSSFDTYQEVNEGDFVFCMFDNEETPRAVGLSSLHGMITGAYDVMSLIDNGVNKEFLNYYFLWVDDGKRLKPLYKGLRKTVPLDSFLAYKIPLPPLAEQEAIVAYLDAETGRIDKAIAAEEKMIALLQERREIVINEAVVARDGWEVKYGKCIFCENKRKNKALDQETILSLSYGKIVVKKSRDEGLVPAEYSSYQVLSPGNIVIRCTDLQNDQTSLRVGYVENHGIITSAYLGLIVNEGYYPKFVFYCLHAWDVSKEIYRYGSGLRQSLSWVDFKYLPLSFPPLAEQEAIVARLDEETGKIDRAIEVKRRQIELLRERRQIVIEEVVTGKVKVA